MNNLCATVAVVFADCDLAATGKALADPARATMLLRMMDGQAHTASDLASAAEVSPTAATAHLRHLVDAGLVSVRTAGRRKLHALSSPQVAAAIEAISVISPLLPVESLRQARTGTHLKNARVCYSHLGGAIAVAIAEQLVRDGVIDHLAVGESSELRTLDHPLLNLLDVIELASGRNPAARGCADWTEERPHIGGRLGITILKAMLDHNWVARRPRGRALVVTDRGHQQLTALGTIPAEETHATESHAERRPPDSRRLDQRRH
jgi:DNA-binding transcriptional ArsR family regulator